MSPVEVSVSGTSSLHRYPERGIIYFRVKSVGLSQREVSDDARSAAERISKQLEELYNAPLGGATATNAASLNKDVGPLTYYTINSLSTAQTQEFATNDDDMIIRNPDGTPLKEWTEYTATISGDAIFQDFAKLSEVAAALSITKDVSITGTKWILLEETERDMVADSVRHAYASALARARAYAEEMGLCTVRPVSVDDQGDHIISSIEGGSHGRVKQTARKTLRESNRITPGTGKILTFAPKDVTLSGRCDVKFEIF